MRQGGAIRALRAEDEAAWWAFRLAALEESPEAFLVTAEEVRAMDGAARTARWASMRGDGDGDGFVLGYEAEGRLLGALGLRREAFPRRRHLAELWGMYVAPDARGGGAGRALLEEAIRRARAMEGLRRLRLGVSEGNDAAGRLYEALGFREFAVEPASLRLADGRELDERWMELVLVR